MGTFKALASDTRLDILKALDGKKMNLKDISKATNLNKATLHEHLTKLYEAGLVKKKEREGHKWVYYKLSWKGEGLLHPENTRIVVLFTATFIALGVGIIQLINYIQSKIASLHPMEHINAFGNNIKGQNTGIEDYVNESKAPGDILINRTGDGVYTYGGGDGTIMLCQNTLFLHIAIICFIVFTIVLCIAIWRFKKNKIPKL